ncbi:MAG: hypothetical protein IJF73_06220 [Clostridia bacterium]|nr:hypothetical protein [Clostridia bacterium]
MITCRFAGLTVAADPRYPYYERLVRDYRCDGAPDLTLSVTEAELLAEDAGKNAGADLGILEALALYRKLSLALPAYGGLFLHAACLSVDGCGVAVTAPSGVGKSTHAALWKELLGERCEIVNGDKPLIRRGEDGRFYGYGTPFCGKEGWQRNTAVPLTAIVLLERGAHDEVVPTSPAEAFPLLYAATLPPRDEAGLRLLLPLLSSLAASVRLYRARCTPRPSAAALCYRTIFEKESSL